MLPINWMLGPKEQKDREFADLLTRANTPEPIAELPVEPEDSRKESLKLFLSALGAALTAGGGGAPNFDAVRMLEQRRKERRDREDQNVRARGTNKSASEKARAKAEAELMMHQMGREEKQDDRLYQEGVAERLKAEKAAAEMAKREQDLDDERRERRYDLRLQAAKAGAVLPRDADEDSIFNAITAQEKRVLDNRLAGKEEKIDRELVGTGNTIAIEIVTGLPESADRDGNRQPATPALAQRLESGETPEDILDEFEMALAMKGIIGKERVMAMETFDRYAGPVFRQWKKNKAEQPPPMPVQTGGDPNMRDALGAVAPSVARPYQGPSFEFTPKEKERRAKKNAESLAKQMFGLDIKR